jgi:hypothetical protein
MASKVDVAAPPIKLSGCAFRSGSGPAIGCYGSGGTAWVELASLLASVGLSNINVENVSKEYGIERHVAKAAHSLTLGRCETNFFYLQCSRVGARHAMISYNGLKHKNGAARH